MKKRLSLLLVSLSAVTIALSVAPHSAASPSSVAATSGLEAASILALFPVGEAGTTSQEERQFKAIFALERTKAKLELERIYSSRNPQAMSYALVGMRNLDKKRYAEMLVAARSSNVTVETMWGCILLREKLQTIANDLDAGKYDGWLAWMPKPSL